jgi:hypothetical protein
MWRSTLLAAFALICNWTGTASVGAADRTPEELRSFILTPEELGGGFVTLFEEPDVRQPSFFRVLERRTPALAVLGVIALSDPALTSPR